MEQDGPGPLLSPCAQYAQDHGIVLAESAAGLTELHAEAAIASGKEAQQLGVCSPLIDLSPLTTAEWFTFPFQRTYTFRWDTRLLGPWLVATLASTLETMGDITATARRIRPVSSGKQHYRQLVLAPLPARSHYSPASPPRHRRRKLLFARP